MTANIIAQEFDDAIPIDHLAEHPDNPRRGDDDAVTESIESNEFFGAILVQKSTGLILAGNTRYRAMKAAGAESLPGFRIDCDDATAKRILLADNRVSDLAYYDDSQLLRMLESVHDDQGSLDGTGYDQTSYELLMHSYAAGGIAPDGDPTAGYIPENVPEGSYRSQYGVIVVCESEDEQRTVFDDLTGQGLTVRVVVT